MKNSYQFDDMSTFREYVENEYAITYRYSKNDIRYKAEGGKEYKKLIYARNGREAAEKARLLLPLKYAIVSVRIHGKRRLCKEL